MFTELGRHGFALENDHTSHVEYVKRIVRIAIEMGCTIITTHVGKIPVDKSSPIYIGMKAA